MALTPEEKAELRKKQQALTDEDFLAMDEVEFVTYVDIGYGDQTPYAPQRPEVEAVILGNV